VIDVGDLALLESEVAVQAVADAAPPPRFQEDGGLGIGGDGFPGQLEPSTCSDRRRRSYPTMMLYGSSSASAVGQRADDR
jgi:hypothetical protein